MVNHICLVLILKNKDKNKKTSIPTSHAINILFSV